MKVIFKKPETFGNRSYPKGECVVPDSLLNNMAFKKLVAAGGVSLVRRDAVQQGVQLSHDRRAAEIAKEKYKASHAKRAAFQSAPAPSSAQAPAQSVVAKAVQPVQEKSSKPVTVGVAKASPTSAPEGKK